jgi:hypothetical protein
MLGLPAASSAVVNAGVAGAGSTSNQTNHITVHVKNPVNSTPAQLEQSIKRAVPEATKGLAKRQSDFEERTDKQLRATQMQLTTLGDSR